MHTFAAHNGFDRPAARGDIGEPGSLLSLSSFAPGLSGSGYWPHVINTSIYIISFTLRHRITMRRITASPTSLAA
jgi:hypothetical protein